MREVIIGVSILCGWYDRRLIDSEGYPYEYYEKPEWCKVTEVGARVGKS